MTPIEARDYLTRISNYCKAREAMLELLADEAFCKASGSSTAHHEHHVGEGALLVHTAEVMSIALASTGAHLAFNPIPNTCVIAAAALFHDCEKRRDYEALTQPDGSVKWVKTEHAKYIYHVAGSYATWVDAARRHGYSDAFAMAVGHCILAHHGRREYGSPVEPQTIEALLLHQADMASARYGRGR